MKKNVSRIIGLVMVAIAIAFFVFALNHPEMSFPFFVNFSRLLNRENDHVFRWDCLR